MVGILGSLRLRQWIKNLLVFVAPAAAGVLTRPPELWRACATFVCFCLASSVVYLVNDVVDVDADSRHPTKRHRPVASGRLSPAAALMVAAFLAVPALGGSWLVGSWQLTLVVAAFLITAVSYALCLKREPVVELVAVAAGFVLRAVAGGVATHVQLSSWFLVVTCFGALFLVTGKRVGEQEELGENKVLHRPVLAEYTPSFLRSTLVLCASGTVTGYCLWAFERGGLLSTPGHHVVLIQLTVIPVILGVLYVLRLLDAGRGGAPEDLALHDRRLQGFGLLWLVLMTAGLYA